MIVTITSCFCQELPDLKKYNKDIGFNTNILLSGILYSGGSPFDLMLKKQKASNTAFRFGISIYAAASNDVNVYNQQGYNQYSNYNLSISVGKEIQKQINKRWIFYYGTDLAPFINFNQRKNYSQNNPPNQSYYLFNQNNTITYGLRLIPFLGIRFDINERLYIATQINLICSFNRKEASQKLVDANSISSNNYIYNSSTRSFNEGSLNLNPASGIFFFYRF